MTTGTAVTTRRLIVGCGYLGRRIGRIWALDGGETFALTRKQERFDDFRREGWSPLLGDICGEHPTWPEVDTVLIAVGFDRGSGKTIEEVYVEGVRSLIATLPETIRQLIYISSTGVYCSAAAEIVDESTPCQPDRPGGKACLDAERLLQQSRFADRTVILRLAGIYGPARVPRLQALRTGKSIAANPDGYLNLIHVDDAAAIVAAVEKSAQPPKTYCVSDGQPCRRGDFLRRAAELMKLPVPSFSPDTDDSPRRGGDKRIDSRRLFQEVPVSLTYPTYASGLKDAIARS